MVIALEEKFKIGDLVQCNKEINITYKMKIKGRIYKFKKEQGEYYAYIKTENGSLWRFKLDNIEFIDNSKSIKDDINDKNYN